MNELDLGNLANPDMHNEIIEVSELPNSVPKKYLEAMLNIRIIEDRLAQARKENLIGGPVHLGAGQEAVAVGISAQLTQKDRVFGGHRSHPHILALNLDPHKLFAEILGKDTGFSKGMGGSMHLWDQKNGFYGSVPIVAGTVPLAVGAGLAAKMQETNDIAVAYFGDGAMEEGVVHESLNLAKVHDIPVLFVAENNLFASHMHISERQPSDATARFAQANGIPYKLVDGNNIIKVQDAAEELISHIRLGNGPMFIEALTFRWYGHVDWRDDTDVGVNRSEEDIRKWRKRDAIKRLKEGMIEAGYWSEDEHIELISKIEERIEECWNMAMKDPYPNEEALLDRVYY